MIPLRDENPPRAFPFVTYLLIAANVVVFIWQLTSSDREVYRYVMIPAELVSGRDVGPVETIHPFF